MFLSALVPALDEIRTVGPVLDDLAATLRRSGVDHEIIFIDDGSTDGTGEEAHRRGIRVIRHETPQGYGNALMAGARAARGEWLLFIDADGTYPVDAIPSLLAAAGEADMVVGTRTGESVHIPFLNRLAKVPIRGLVSFISGRRVADFNSGLRLVRRREFELLRPLLPPRFSLTTTLTVGMLCRGRRVVDVPINYARRLVASKFTPFGDTWRLLSGLLRLGLMFRPGGVLAPPAALLGLGAAACRWLVPGPAGAASAGPLLALALWLTGALALALWQRPAWRRVLEPVEPVEPVGSVQPGEPVKPVEPGGADE